MTDTLPDGVPWYAKRFRKPRSEFVPKPAPIRKKRRKTKRPKQKVADKPVKPKWIDYASYLVSDWWKSRRARKLRAAGFKCNRCGSTSDLAVHHRHYRTLYGEKDGDLEVLCRVCHDAEHTAVVDGNAHLRSINNVQ